MSLSCSFDTARLRCRPLIPSDFGAFSTIVSSESDIYNYLFDNNTNINLLDFYSSVVTQHSQINVGIFSKSTSAMVGCILGKLSSPTQLSVRIFISQSFRSENFAYEALSAYVFSVSHFTIETLKFVIKSDNIAAKSLLNKFSYSKKLEGFADKKTGDLFEVYQICQ